MKTSSEVSTVKITGERHHSGVGTIHSKEPGQFRSGSLPIRLKKGDRVRYSPTYLYGGFSDRASREQCYGTVSSSPRQDDTVCVLWDGRTYPDSVGRTSLELA